MGSKTYTLQNKKEQTKVDQYTKRSEKKSRNASYHKNKDVRSILSVTIINVTGLYSPLKTEGLSEFKRINPALSVCGKFLDWLS